MTSRLHLSPTRSSSSRTNLPSGSSLEHTRRGSSSGSPTRYLRSLILRTWCAVFRALEGEATISPTGQIAGTLTVSAASIDTAHARRDTHLRGARFLHVEQHPDITFVLNRIGAANQTTTVSGFLTVRDRTEPITFPAAVTIRPDEIHLDAVVPIDRRDYGISYNILGMTSMKNTLTVHATFTR